MPLVIGLDIGTTTITAIAVDENGVVRDSRTRPNDAETTAVADKKLGYCEWNAERISELAFRTLRDLSANVDGIEGLAITGQQHGCALIDLDQGLIGPLINWQDRRADLPFPGRSHSVLAEAIERLGDSAPSRCGCKLAAGYMATTLFWRAQNEDLSDSLRACFISDLVASILAGELPVTDPTLAASAGVWNLVDGEWDADAIGRLGLPHSLFPDVLPSGSELGRLTPEGAADTGLPVGIPVFVGLGDHQASILGAAAEPANSLFINVGTGGQVAAYIKDFQYDSALETRPFPDGGYELVSAGLTGGKAYAVLETFIRSVGAELFGGTPSPIFGQLNALAAGIPPGCDGLRCDPSFAGTRQDPTRTATWTGMTERNFTPGHMARAVLEGMARALRDGAERIENLLPHPRPILVGAGNGIRENPLFVEILLREFGRLIRVPHHREEAAYGAAIVAAVGAGLLPDFAAASQWIRYDDA